jgi:hypothetical protein
MPKSVRVPEPMQALFDQAETFVGGLFETLVRRPEKGTVHVGDERYVIMRAESLFLAWFTALDQAFGSEVAREFIYNTAREIGRADSTAFAARLDLTDPVAKLSCGPVHFAHAGWAFVDPRRQRPDGERGVLHPLPPPEHLRVRGAAAAR